MPDRQVEVFAARMEQSGNLVACGQTSLAADMYRRAAEAAPDAEAKAECKRLQAEQEAASRATERQPSGANAAAAGGGPPPPATPGSGLGDLDEVLRSMQAANPQIFDAAHAAAMQQMQNPQLMQQMASMFGMPAASPSPGDRAVPSTNWLAAEDCIAGVMICGVVSDPVLNGQVGTIIGSKPANGRYVVRMNSGGTKSLHPKNVQLPVGTMVQIIAGPARGCAGHIHVAGVDVSPDGQPTVALYAERCPGQLLEQLLTNGVFASEEVGVGVEAMPVGVVRKDHLRAMVTMGL